MPGKVSSLYGSRFGSGKDERHVQLGQTTCRLLFFSKVRSGMLFTRRARGFFFFWYGGGAKRWFWGFLVSPWCLVHIGVLALLALLCVQGLGLKDVPPAGPALWAEVSGGIIFVTSGEFAGGIIFVTSGEFAGQHKILPVNFVGKVVILVVSSCTCLLQWDSPVSTAFMDVLFTGLKGHSGEIAGKGTVRPLFSPNMVFLFSRHFFWPWRLELTF